jgi:hypothetical protein
MIDIERLFGFNFFSKLQFFIDNLLIFSHYFNFNSLSDFIPSKLMVFSLFK